MPKQFLKALKKHWTVGILISLPVLIQPEAVFPAKWAINSTTTIQIGN
jgi:hypothetical protein